MTTVGKYASCIMQPTVQHCLVHLTPQFPCQLCRDRQCCHVHSILSNAFFGSKHIYLRCMKCIRTYHASSHYATTHQVSFTNFYIYAH